MEEAWRAKMAERERVLAEMDSASLLLETFRRLEREAPGTARLMDAVRREWMREFIGRRTIGTDAPEAPQREERAIQTSGVLEGPGTGAPVPAEVDGNAARADSVDQIPGGETPVQAEADSSTPWWELVEGDERGERPARMDAESQLTPGEGGPREEAPPREKRRRAASRPRGCWNCGGSHRYSECTQSQRENFCYGCGRRGTTLCHCPNCGPGWRQTGGPGAPDRAPGRRPP